MADRRVKTRSGWRQVAGLVVLSVAVLLLLSVISYDPDDIPVLCNPPQTPPANFIGPAGAWSAFLVFMALGAGGYLVAPAGLTLAGFLLFSRKPRVWLKAVWLLFLLLSFTCLFQLQYDLWEAVRQHINAVSAGGVVGMVLINDLLARFLGEVGAGIVCSTVLLISMVLLFEVEPASLGDRLSGWGSSVIAVCTAARRAVVRLWSKGRAAAAAREQARRRLESAVSAGKDRVSGKPDDRRPPAAKPRIGPAVRPSSRQKKTVKPDKQAPLPEPAKSKSVPEKTAPAPAAQAGKYRLPPLDLLLAAPSTGRGSPKSDFQNGSRLLQETLAEFGIEAEVTDVSRGPVVTCYEVLPAPGVKVERIAGLSNNIALAMKAETVRVEAPIPGKGVVGIEVPNPKTSLVTLREVLSSADWAKEQPALPLAIGKDVSGRVIVGDLADMPHLLIAGATGSGKTVCINSLLTGLLMARTPEQMRLMMIDPKIVEFSAYKNLPHLVVPVITDPKKVSLGLRWAINEMEKRYKLFARAGVRNIGGFNSRPIERQESLFAAEDDAPAADIPERLPYIVIVIDELADLMMVAQAEIENSIARLAQLSRAVGIHMMIATQRPTVNVITGTIKANFPARIAFQVAQKNDSRTILDANGADKLLGKGDMLYLPPGSSKLLRAQGVMTSDTEINGVVDFIRDQSGPSYEMEIKEAIESRRTEASAGEEDDDMMEKAIEIIRQTKRASTSSLQRRLRIGYTRAARLMDIMEERGIVGPTNGAEPREILVDLDARVPGAEDQGKAEDA